MNKRTSRKTDAPRLPRFRAPKRMTSVKFMSKKDKLKHKRQKKVYEEEQT